MPAAMPCKTPVNCRGESCRSVGKRKTQYACIVDADETMRIRLEGVPNRYHEDHIFAEVHKFIPLPQALKISFAKAAVEKEWKNSIKCRKVEESRNEGRKVQFASLMDRCHLKNSELEPQYQKYKDRVVFRGDIVKDDSGSYVVFTEQGSSASHMTAAKVMDIMSRLPGCAGQAADAVSAVTQVKMEDAPTLLKIPKSECPDVYRYTNGPNHGPVWKTQLFLFSGICTVIFWQDCCGHGNSRKFF